MNSAVAAQLLEIIMAPESFAVNRKLNMQTGCQGFYFFIFRYRQLCWLYVLSWNARHGGNEGRDITVTN